MPGPILDMLAAGDDHQLTPAEMAGYPPDKFFSKSVLFIYLSCHSFLYYLLKIRKYFDCFGLVITIFLRVSNL